MEINIRLLHLSILLILASSCSGEMFLESGVFTFNMSTKMDGNEIFVGLQKSLFAEAEVAVQVVSCETSDKKCEFTLEWTLRQSDCDKMVEQLFQSANSSADMNELYYHPNCFYMAEESTIAHIQSVQHKLNSPITCKVETDSLVLPVNLQDLTEGMTCSNREHEEPCATIPPCGAGVVIKEDHEANPPSETANDADHESRRRKRAGKAKQPTAEQPGEEQTKTEPEAETKAEPETEPETEPEAEPETKAAPTKKPTKLKFRVAETNERDGRFLFILVMKSPSSALNVTIKVQMKSPSGYLSATQYPLLPFYGTMCAVYSIFGLVWLVLLFRQWRDLLRIQFWISAVIIIGLIEKAAFVAEFDRHNKTGESANAGVFIAEELSVLKRTMARMLVIVVSLGYGITRPRLGKDLNWVLGAGSLFFILSTLEAYFRITQSTTNGLIALLPLSVLDAVLCWWIFRSLVDTSRTLRLRRNLVKLWLYRHFTNALIFCVVAAIIFLAWSIYTHKMNKCVKKWNEIWLDDAYWHILFCVILGVTMILIRPTANNQRYAYSVLSDAADDEEGSKEPMMNDAFENLKLRPGHSKTGSQNRKEVDDLQWVEDNIPAAVADTALGAFDDSEEELITSVERNKME